MPVYVSVNWYLEEEEGSVTRRCEISHQVFEDGRTFHEKRKIFITAYRAVLDTYVTTQVEPSFVTE
jgi:hypothetical protein